jgi:HAMP domain-containing protein
VTLTKSTKRWLAAFAIAVVLIVIDGGAAANRLGILGALAWMAFVAACLVLLFRGVRAAFRLVVRRLTLRLAFSYFLIGIVPIPLLATLAFALFYVVTHQFVATRVWHEATEMASTATGLPGVQVRDGKVVRSEVTWLEPGNPAPWVAQVDRPRAVIEGKNVWIAVRDEHDGGNVRLLFLNDPFGAWMKKLADRTGYAVKVETGRAKRGRGGFQMDVGSRSAPPKGPTSVTVRPSALPAPTKGREWIGAVYLERAVAVVNASVDNENTVVFIATTSPQVVFDQLFAQGIPGIARIFRVVTMGLAAALLFVYLIALALAFALVSTITRNVNRMSRAAQGIARGDFSVRVNTKSRDQIGDLARSFDGMAGSIQKLLVETARKERLEGEIAVARTIQQKLLPPASATLDGARILAHVRSVAEIGGDYYDYLPMPDGRSAIVVGDVSGHGLPTGLLVAMAKAGLATLIETGLTGPPLFTRLNDLIHRSTDSRNYMTLALLVYDAKSRRGELTNAGQLAPYRVSKGRVESLSLPSFPLGASERSEFPTRTWDFVAGDTVVLLTDGLVECLSPAGEPFGFERFEAILARESASPPEKIRDVILAEIDAHTGGADPDDDRTLVIVTLE